MRAAHLLQGRGGFPDVPFMPVPAHRRRVHHLRHLLPCRERVIVGQMPGLLSEWRYGRVPSLPRTVIHGRCQHGPASLRAQRDPPDHAVLYRQVRRAPRRGEGVHAAEHGEPDASARARAHRGAYGLGRVPEGGQACAVRAGELALVRGCDSVRPPLPEEQGRDPGECGRALRQDSRESRQPRPPRAGASADAIRRQTPRPRFQPRRRANLPGCVDLPGAAPRHPAERRLQTWQARVRQPVCVRAACRGPARHQPLLLHHGGAQARVGCAELRAWRRHRHRVLRGSHPH
mmetsp:Transcript_16156/g.38987  ORF Transcript_16156/g.38987 Transcript_16156/m.38987 type:complete len:289 (+) Transcript_16156:895-1761(+)